MQEFYYICVTIYFVITILPLIKYDGWWVRIFEFPRLQIMFMGLILFFYSTVIYENSSLHIMSMLIVCICMLYHLYKIAPYTKIYPCQVLSSKQGSKSNGIKLMVSNVFMDNSNYEGLASLINHYAPDILLVVEANNEWYENLSNKIKFSYDVAIPLDNTYGMVLFSNLKIEYSSIDYLIEDDVPSIYARIMTPSGMYINLHCLHPKPPAPQESLQTTERDAELLLVGKGVKKETGATIVAGDLNDVAWSYTTTLFQKISGLLDPRIGRGMFSSFHVKTPFFRFPLDHVFASEELRVKSLKRLPSFGSDHFPIFIEYEIDCENSMDHDIPVATRSDKVEAVDKINEAR